MYTDVSAPVLSQVEEEVKYSCTIHKYTRMLSRNTAMPEFNMLKNRLFMVYIKVASAFVSCMGITTYM